MIEVDQQELLEENYSVLISEEKIHQRLVELGNELVKTYAGEIPILIGVLNGGFVFMAGQCLVGHSYDTTGATFGPPVYMQRGISKTVHFDQPFTNSLFFYQQGLDCLKHSPIRLLEKISENYYLFFGNVSWPTSNQPPFHLAMKASHVLFNLLVFPGILLAMVFRSHKSLTILLWLILLTIFLTSTIYYADIRYRLPYDAIFILLALTGYQSLIKKLHPSR